MATELSKMATENFKKKDNLKEDVPQWVTESVKAGLLKLKDDTNLTGKINENLDEVTARTFYYKVNGDKVEYQIDNVKSYLNAIKNKEWSDLKDLSGAWILSVQIALESLGYEVGKIDGWFGGETKNGVLRFQKQNGLNQDGFPGKETIAKLCEALNKPEDFKAKQDSKPDGVSASAGASSGSSSGEKSDGVSASAGASSGSSSGEKSDGVSASAGASSRGSSGVSGSREASASGSSGSATEKQKGSVVENSGNIDNGFLGTLNSREEKDSVIEEIKKQCASSLKTSNGEPLYFDFLNDAPRLYLKTGIGNPSTVSVPMELEKCLQSDGTLAKSTVEHIIKEKAKLLVKKKKTVVGYLELKKLYDNHDGKFRITAESLSLHKETNPLIRGRIDRYFKEFDDNGIVLDNRGTKYDLNTCKIKLELDDDGWNQKYNIRKNNSELEIDADSIVNNDYTLNKNKFLQKLKNIILNIINGPDFNSN